MTGRTIGVIFLLLSLSLLAWDAFAYIIVEAWSFQTIDGLWRALNAQSRDLIEQLFKAHISPSLWDYSFGWVMAQPAMAVFFVIGVLCLMLFRPKDPIEEYRRRIHKGAGGWESRRHKRLFGL